MESSDTDASSLSENGENDTEMSDDSIIRDELLSDEDDSDVEFLSVLTQCSLELQVNETERPPEEHDPVENDPEIYLSHMSAMDYMRTNIYRKSGSTEICVVDGGRVYMTRKINLERDLHALQSILSNRVELGISPFYIHSFATSEDTVSYTTTLYGSGDIVGLLVAKLRMTGTDAAVVLVCEGFTKDLQVNLLLQRALLETFIDFCRTRDIHAFQVSVSERRKTQIQFYEKYGLSTIRTNWKNGETEHIMKLKIYREDQPFAERYIKFGKRQHEDDMSRSHQEMALLVLLFTWVMLIPFISIGASIGAGMFIYTIVYNLIIASIQQTDFDPNHDSQ